MKGKAGPLNERGVTLIELLAVIVILGILAAIAVPAVFKNYDDAREKADKTTEQVLINAAKLYVMEKGGFKALDTDNDNTVDVLIQNLKNEGYLDENTETKKQSVGQNYTKVRITKIASSNTYRYECLTN